MNKTTNRFRKVPQQWNPSKDSIINRCLPVPTINRIARECGFIKRQRKITPQSLIVGFMRMASKGMNTFQAWASEVSILEHQSISKQAIEERMTGQAEEMLRQLLAEKLSARSNPLSGKWQKVIGQFTSVKIEDSTMVALPDELAHAFPGNVSKGKQKALAKIHALHNLTANHFCFLHLHSFSQNDQSLSAHCLPHLQKGDLLIRDLGFTVLDTTEQLLENGHYFISRKNHQVKLYEVGSQQEMDVLGLLRKNNSLDTEVWVGKKKKLKLRLIALPLAAPQAQQRRRKARQDRDRRLHHSRDYYRLLGYSIYLTNVPCQLCTAEQIAQLYGLRWRIEIIFKSWKSCFAFQQLMPHQCTNPIRIKCIIYLLLLYIYLFQVIWFNAYQSQMPAEHPPSLSILKMATFFRQHWSWLMHSEESNESLRKLIHRNCSYDKRKDRKNYVQIFYKLAA